MKQVPQNEIDVLLRRWSQSEHVGAAEAESAHLDPDELSAYAENALPPAARAKYTEHLADCSACRRIVADLAPLTATVPLKKEATFSVSAFLSKLIAPSVLRYAVPSLAAVLILAMGFFVMNRQSSNRQVSETVAKNEQPQVAPGEQLNDSSPTNVDAATKTESGNTHDQSPTTAKAAQPKPAEATAAVPQAQATPADAPADVKRYQQEQDKKSEVARVDVARQTASQPAAATLSPGTVGGERELAKSRDEDSKKKVAASEPPPQPAPAKEAKEEARKLDSTEVAAAAPKSQQAPVARRARGIGGMASNTVGRDDQDKNTANKDEAETRKVGGRSFRKLNGVWTDTAYDSRATTNLSRGSEQFRALVADEPAIRSIAEQLDGEVIVVWKGRAYRIR